MGARGRKSGDDLAIIASDGVVKAERPKPPDGFTSEQKAVWRSIVNDHAASFFHGRTELLEAYCRHVVALRHVGALIKQAEEPDVIGLKDYNQVLIMQERESRALASHSVRLGLAYSTAYDKRRNSNDRKPWE